MREFITESHCGKEYDQLKHYSQMLQRNICKTRDLEMAQRQHAQCRPGIIHCNNVWGADIAQAIGWFSNKL